MGTDFHTEFVRELRNQIDLRITMAIDKKYEYEGDDPICSLPLTEYQRGLIAGRLGTWEFFSELIPDTVKLVRDRLNNESQ